MLNIYLCKWWEIKVAKCLVTDLGCFQRELGVAKCLVTSIYYRNCIGDILLIIC